MALQALLFSKNPETVQSLTAILAEAGIRTEVCADIFSAIEKAKKQNFQCVVADWADQPESGFLVKRTRESAPNRDTVALAIVDDELTAKRARENQIEFVFFRPIAQDEARAVLANARQQMKLPSGATRVNLRAALAESDADNFSSSSEDPNLLATAADLPKSSQHDYQPAVENEERVVEDVAAEDEIVADEFVTSRRSFRPGLRNTFAVALLGLAVFCLWRGRAGFLYLARTPEGSVYVLRQSFRALFYVTPSGAQSIGSARTEAQQDAYFSRSADNSATPPTGVQVVTGEVTVPEIHQPLARAFDLPLPVPELVPLAAAPPRRTYARVPESIKNSAPITPALVVTVNPAAQLVPASIPAPAIPQVSEPVPLNEEAARAMAVHVVDAVYPREAMTQKLHGSVVLQAVIGRDGSVQDVKIVRGYFLLGRAAVAAVKQWRFRPYNVNGQPVSFRTQITLSFSYPPA